MVAKAIAWLFTATRTLKNLRNSFTESIFLKWKSVDSFCRKSFLTQKTACAAENSFSTILAKNLTAMIVAECATIADIQKKNLKAKTPYISFWKPLKKPKRNTKHV